MRSDSDCSTTILLKHTMVALITRTLNYFGRILNNFMQCV